jgi:hypothetical protein
MLEDELKTFSVIDILDVLTDIANDTGDNELLVQCKFYAKRIGSYNEVFYNWANTVVDRNGYNFIKKIRQKKIKKINLHLDHTDY